MVIQGIKERPRDGCPWEEGEIWGDPGKIHRSVGVQCSGVSEKKENGEEVEVSRRGWSGVPRVFWEMTRVVKE